MRITTRKLRTAGIAIAVFAAGASIGWQIADHLLAPAQSPPMVAAIHLDTNAPGEGERQHAPTADAPEGRTGEAGTPPQTMAVVHQPVLAEFDNQGWSAVAENTKRFGAAPPDVQRSIQTQVEREITQSVAAQQVRVAAAIGRLEFPAIAAQPLPTRIAQRPAAKKKAVRRTARIAHRKPHRTRRALVRTADPLCPLAWLQAALDDLWLDHTRRYRWAG